MTDLMRAGVYCGKLHQGADQERTIHRHLAPQQHVRAGCAPGRRVQGQPHDQERHDREPGLYCRQEAAAAAAATARRWRDTDCQFHIEPALEMRQHVCLLRLFSGNEDLFGHRTAGYWEYFRALRMGGCNGSINDCTESINYFVLNLWILLCGRNLTSGTKQQVRCLDFSLQELRRS